MTGIITPIETAGFLPVSVADAKAHLRVDFDDEDAGIEAMIRAAVAAVEDATGRTLAAGTYRYDVPDFSSTICIPAFPVRDVTGITYLDQDGNAQTVDVGSPSANWYWLPTASGADVRFSDDYSSPTVSSRPDAVRITFEAGYEDPSSSPTGDARLQLDPRLSLAVLAHVGTAYSYRESVSVGQMPADLAPVFKLLCQQLRIYR